MPTKKKAPAKKKVAAKKPVAAKSRAKAPAKSRASKSKPARKPERKAASKPQAPRRKSVPEGMHSVMPHLVCAGAADAIEFYKAAFGALEEGRMPGPGGKIMHAMVRIEGSPVMLVDEMPEWETLGPKALNGSPVTIHLYVDDVDSFVARAVEAGAKVTMPVDDMFWGDRYGKLEDPFGHRWSVATHVRDVTPEEMQAAMEKMAEGRPSSN